MTIEQAFDNFINNRKRPKKLKATTKGMYQSVLAHFQSVIPKVWVIDLRIEDLLVYCATARFDTTFTDGTTAKYIQIVQQFFVWLQNVPIKNNLFADGRGVARWYDHNLLKKDRVISDAAFDAMLVVAQKHKRTGVRDEAILRLMEDLGLFPDTVAAIKMSECNLSRSELYATTEIGLYCEFMYTGKTAKAIKRWQRIRPESDYLFCQENGEALTGNAVRQIIRRVARGSRLSVYPDGFYHRYIYLNLRESIG